MLKYSLSEVHVTRGFSLFFFILPERGVEYEFRVSAKNSVDYGEPSSEKLTTPDGSELYSCLIQCL